MQEVEAYRTESVFGNQKDLCERRLGFSLDYYKYLEEFNIVKLTTSDGLEYFGVNSIIYALSKFDPTILKVKDQQSLDQYFDQKIKNPQDVVNLDNSINHTSYKLSIAKQSRDYQFIKDESLRKTCQDIGVGKFIPRCLVIHFSIWLSNTFYLIIQQLVENCEQRRFQREIILLEQKNQENKITIFEQVKEIKCLSNQITKNLQNQQRIIDRGSNFLKNFRKEMKKHKIDVVFFDQSDEEEQSLDKCIDKYEETIENLSSELNETNGELRKATVTIQQQSKKIEKDQEYTIEIMKQLNDLKSNYTDDRANGVKRYIMVNYKREGNDLHINAGFGEEKNVKRTLQKYVDNENYSWGVKIEWINPRTEFKGTFEDILKKKYIIKSNYSCNRFILVNCRDTFKTVIKNFIHELSIKYNQIFDEIMDHCVNIIEFSEFEESKLMELENAEEKYVSIECKDIPIKHIKTSIFVDLIPLENGDYKFSVSTMKLPMDLAIKYHPNMENTLYYNEIQTGAVYGYIRDWTPLGAYFFYVVADIDAHRNKISFDEYCSLYCKSFKYDEHINLFIIHEDEIDLFNKSYQENMIPLLNCFCSKN